MFGTKDEEDKKKKGKKGSSSAGRGFGGVSAEDVALLIANGFGSTATTNVADIADNAADIAQVQADLALAQAAAVAEEQADAAQEATTDAEQTAQDTAIASVAAGVASNASNIGQLDTALAAEIAATDTEQAAQDARLDAIEAQLPDDDSALADRITALEAIPADDDSAVEALAAANATAVAANAAALAAEIAATDGDLQAVTALVLANEAALVARTAVVDAEQAVQDARLAALESATDDDSANTDAIAALEEALTGCLFYKCTETQLISNGAGFSGEYLGSFIADATDSIGEVSGSSFTGSAGSGIVITPDSDPSLVVGDLLDSNAYPTAIGNPIFTMPFGSGTRLSAATPLLSIDITGMTVGTEYHVIAFSGGNSSVSEICVDIEAQEWVDLCELKAKVDTLSGVVDDDSANTAAIADHEARVALLEGATDDDSAVEALAAANATALATVATEQAGQDTLIATLTADLAALAATKTRGALFRGINTNVTAGVNRPFADNFEVPLIGNTEINDDATYYTNNNEQHVNVLKAGRYRIRAGIYLVGDGQRQAPVARITIDGVPVGTIGTSYIRNFSNTAESSISLPEQTFDITTPSPVAVQIWEEGLTTGTVNLTLGTSFLEIEEVLP